METIPRIQALAKEISDKIAAGEVVERPLSIVKELIENALDAGATAIVTEIRNGGKTYIRVTDNGCGIDARDAELVFHRYATSKITSAGDLTSIETLGFRGEALASIAAVSKVELITKTAGRKTGIKVLAEGGQIRKVSETGAEEGTTLIVTDLFFNTPVRKKFLKPDRTESALIIDYLSKVTLAYPGVQFRLISNGTILFSTRGSGDVYQNILTVYSKQTANGLLMVERDESPYRLSGYVSRPDQSRSNRKHQIYFVNGRWIRSKMIDEALREAYADRLFEGRYPAAFLFLRIPPDQLDVNIHPNKTEIRFLDEPPVRDFLLRTLRQELVSEQAAATIPDLKREKTIFLSTPDQDPGDQDAQVDINYISLTDEQERYERILSEASESQAFGGTSASRQNPAPIRFTFSDLEILGTVFASYIAAQGPDAMYLVDQHAAHERVLFEQFMAAGGHRRADAQLLIRPWVLEIPVYLTEVAPLRLTLLREAGYDIHEFGPKEYIVKEIPAFMDAEEAEAFVHHILHLEPEAGRSEPEQEKQRLIAAACKAAVKANDRLDVSEIRALFRSLDQTENPFSCPHGRPTFLRLSRGDIEKMFLRK